jgi:hypothetical protein
MKMSNPLRSLALVAGAAAGIFGGVSLGAPGHAYAGYWTTVCNAWGCRQVYIRTCHHVVVGYDPWGRPIFGRACG